MRNRKNDGIALVSAAGIIVEILKKISDALKNLGGEESDLRLVLSRQGLAIKIAKLIMAYKHKIEEKARREYNVMIERGVYGEVKLIQFNRSSSIDEVLEWLNLMGLESAKEKLLFALGAACPISELWNESIVALGTVSPIGVSMTKHKCSCLIIRGGRSTVEQVQYEDDQWSEDWWFLAVPKAA